MKNYEGYSFTKDDMPGFNKFTTSELERIQVELQKKKLKIESKIKDLMELAKIYEKAVTKTQEREGRKINKELQALVDEEHFIRVAKSNIQSVIIKRRRNAMTISNKALNHGGVYTDAYLAPLKIGIGFKGFAGITL